MADTTATDRLRLAQLRETLAFAVAKSPYYASRFAGRSVAITSLDDLRAFPTLTKAELARNATSIRTSTAFPERTGFTSGTEFDASLERDQSLLVRTMQSAEELEHFTQLAELLSPPGDGPRPLGLKLLSVNHGTQFTRPAPGTFEVPLVVPFHFEHVKRLLLESHEFAGFGARVESIVGSLVLVKLLTALLLREPGLVERLAVRRLFTSSWHLTPRWRAILGELYGARVVSVYGLSEVPGSTTVECPACGGRHAQPIVVPEILPLSRDDEHVGIGELGELTLTALVPFGSLQPIVRYRTGDLVERLPPCDAVPDLGFRLRGRRRKALLDDRSRVLLDGASIYEAVDALPDVARKDLPAFEVFGVGRPFGLPRYRVGPARPDGRGGAHATLDVELHYHPRFHPVEAERVHAAVTDALDAAHAALAAPAAPALRLEVRLHAPGTLPPEIGELQ